MSSGKRTNYISWDEFFMGIAKLAAQRSKDPETQVGAVVVGEDNKILGVGYNGLARGCSDDKFPWAKPHKHLYVVHAEANALLNTNNFNLLKGSTMYCIRFPCCECAKLIIQLGLKKIIFLNYKSGEKYVAAKKMFRAVNIKYSQFGN